MIIATLLALTVATFYRPRGKTLPMPAPTRPLAVVSGAPVKIGQGRWLRLLAAQADGQAVVLAVVCDRFGNVKSRTSHATPKAAIAVAMAWYGA